MRKKERPLGLWILPAFDAVALGILPLLQLLIAYSNPELEISAVILTFLAALYLTVIAAAYGAWSGDNVWRLVLLHSASLTCIVLIVGNAQGIEDLLESPNLRILDLIGNIYRGVIWLAWISTQAF
jgi:hypothetical protein